MATPTTVAQQVQAIQQQKETAQQKANAQVMTDQNAVHAVVTPYKSAPVAGAAATGAGIGFLFGGPLGAAVGAGIGAVAEHYRIGGGVVNKLFAKIGLFQIKAPPGAMPVTPPGPAVPPPAAAPGTRGNT